MVQLTDNAVKKLKVFSSENPDFQGKGFRVYVQGGGCSGFSYGFSFDEKRDGDEVNTAGDLNVYVDSASAPHLNGSKIDYVEDMRGSGFVVENPNVKSSCGCGNSHSF